MRRPEQNVLGGALEMRLQERSYVFTSEEQMITFVKLSRK